MNINKRFKKIVAWSLIATMVNPAVVAPTFARDTDIFLSVTTGSSTAEPNVMVVLDTSDSMNIPEPWHEIGTAELVNPGNPDDPANYDSHYEYLWNDNTFIYSIGCNVANCSNDTGGSRYSVAGAAPGKNNARYADYDINMASMPQGFFAGADAAARGALKQAAINWAATTFTGDPGSRTAYRNYNNANWVYWLPSGTPETDLRLMALSFSRAALGSNVTSFSSVNGSSNPVSRGGITYPNINDFANANYNFTSYTYQQSNAQNRCTASYQFLLPSTVYAPGPYPKNAGHWNNQQWVRYERWLALDNSRAQSSFPSAVDATISAKAKWVDAPFYTGFATAPNYFGIGVASAYGAMINNDWQPIRTQNVGVSYAGWTDLRTDMGGHNYRSEMYNYGDASATLVNILAAYGITSSQTVARVRANNRTGEPGAHTSSITGCVDAASCALLGVSLGVSGYYDVAANATDPSYVPPTTTCSFVKVPNSCTGPDANGAYSCPGGDIITLASGAPWVVQDGPDAKNNNRRYFVAANTTFLKTGGNSPVTGCALSGGSSNWSPNDNKNSGWVGRQTTVSEGTTYYWGGTCQGQCSYGVGQSAQCAVGAHASPGPGNNSSVQPAPTYSTKTVTYASLTVGAGTLTDVRLDNATNGCGDNGDAANQTITARVGAGVALGNLYEVGLTVTGTPGPATLRVYNRANNEDYLNHDCLADNGAPSYNPGTSYMRAANRNWDQAYNTNTNPASAADSYSTSSGHAITADAAKNVDMYSVNYLNWKYGPRGPNGRQIGRKTRLQIAKDAMADLVQTTDGVRFGLMTFNSLPSDITKRTAEGSQGGHVVYPITRMGSNSTDTPDYNNRAILKTRIFAQQAKAATPLTEAMYEAMMYFTGRAPRFGTNTAINTNFGATSQAALGGGNVADGYDTNAICAAIGPQCLAVGNYKSPIMNNPNTTSPASCQKNFVILITDGGPDRDKDANVQIKNTFFAGTSGTISAKTTVDTVQANTLTDQLQTGVDPAPPYGPISTSDTAYDNGYVWLDELTYFMSRADMSPGARIFVGDAGTDQLTGPQAVITYTVGFAGAASAVLTNAAVAASGNAYTADNAQQLAAALIDAIVSIREWNPTVASPTVPISALNRSENASDVFLAFFKPDTTQAWNGTVKKFRLGQTEADCGTGITLCITGQTTLANPVTCAAANPCKNIEDVEIDPVTGQSTVTVHPQAVSYWANIQDSGTPDLGGSGTQLISNTGTPDFYTPNTRKVFTFVAGGGSGSNQLVLSHANNAMTEANGPPFSSPTALITKTLLGNAGMTDATRSTLINYIRGGDTTLAACSDASTGTACTSWRTWSHGEVEHSKPAIVTYNTTTTPTVQYMYYISNDGLLHAIDTNTGKEKWVFLMEEAMPKIASLLADASGQQLDVSDGSPVVYFVDSNGDGVITPGTDTVYLYFGMRRGGRVYYALDITDRDNPAFMWKITAENAPGTTARVCTGISACTNTTAYNELGQTWSSPVIGKVRALGAATPALVFGGGYDPVEDTIPPGTRSMGRALFVVNGLTGQIVQSWGVGQSGTMLSNSGAIAYAIPSDPAAINADVDAQGFLDRVLIGDLGGNVWRFDINALSAAAWTGKQLASLSDAAGEKRKIMFPPAIVKQNLQISPGNYLRFDGVYVGTGDREHPLCVETTPPATGCSPPNYAPANKFFLIMDTSTGTSSSNVAPFTFTGGDFLHVLDTDTNGVSPAELSVSTVHGWYRDLENGEKVTNAPTVFFQKLRFGTYSPLAQGNACAPPGQGRLNEIAADSAAYVGLNGTPTGVAGDRFYASFLTRGYISTGQVVVLGNTIYHLTVSDARLQAPAIGTLGTATRIYWYMEPEL